MTDQPMTRLQQLENEFSRVAFDAKDKGRYGQSWTRDAAERAEEIHRQVVALVSAAQQRRSGQPLPEQ